MAHEVFICYSSHDVTIADTICGSLESNHLKCWIAPRDVLPGQLWGESVADAIDSSRIVVLVLSSNSSNSSQVTREVERAASNNATIIPFRIDDAPISRAIGFFVGSRHWLNAQTPPLKDHLKQLADTVKQLLNYEPAPQEIITMPKIKEKPAVPIKEETEVVKTVQQALHCPKCGIEVRLGARFCHKCGTPVYETQQY